MSDLGSPSSYLALEEGTPILTSDGESIGRVEHVLAAPEQDIFDGIVLDTSVLEGGHRFVDAPEVEEIYERGVVLKISFEEARELPRPEANPATMSVHPDDTAPDDLADKLRRAWDKLAGRG